ncbi:MAG TPA: hypothetical protein VN730_15340 [Steroidobacteraceae bacterium]|nr:hypothetical protein [Steroidobacteraceae bacterium]
MNSVLNSTELPSQSYEFLATWPASCVIGWRRCRSLRNAENRRCKANDRDRALATLERQLRHMTRLVNDLVDVARIEHGHITLQRQRIRVSEVIDAALETTRPEIDSRATSW